ncbi:hypothetical protein [Sphingomonas psychrolutea]|nr:hypothetical protein [Sphingomonas psychrolutea]
MQLSSMTRPDSSSNASFHRPTVGLAILSLMMTIQLVVAYGHRMLY